MERSTAFHYGDAIYLPCLIGHLIVCSRLTAYFAGKTLVSQKGIKNALGLRYGAQLTSAH